MSAPRQFLPGTTYFVTRRCTQRELWLIPSVLLNWIVLYCFAVAAARAGVVVHAVCVMGNHWHAVVTDPEGEIPDLTHWFDEFVSKCVGAAFGRWETLWSDELTYEDLLDDEAILRAIVYCLANPVKHGLVPHRREWPGLVTKPHDLVGASYPVKRCPVYFSDKGPTPEATALEIKRPAIFPELTDAELATLVARRLHARERNIRAHRQRTGRAFLGRTGVLRQRRGSRPRTPAPRFQRRPRFAGASRAIILAAVARRRAFEARYRECRCRWVAGERDIVFPAGTYALRRYAGVAVEPAGFG